MARDAEAAEHGGEPASSREIHDRLHFQRQMLGRLMRSEAISRGDITGALNQVTELATELLRVERASVWFFDAAHSRIECADLFERTKHAHSQGAVVGRERVPRYFQAMNEERCLAVSDAFTDPRTSEFAGFYLEPHRIGAMLDAPIVVAGEVVGVVCHEHGPGPRQWEFWEELAAATIADFVARVREAADRQRAERELDFYRDKLDQLVAHRTSELTQVNRELSAEVERWQAAEQETRHEEANLRQIFDASPVPLVLVRIADSCVLFVNRRGRDLLQADDDRAVGRSAQDFWAAPEERRAFVRELEQRGRVDSFVAHGRTLAGRFFWAQLSAQRLSFGGDDCYLLSFSDVTAQKLAEAAVRQSARSIRALFAAAPVPLVLTSVSDGRVLLANQRAADLYGVPLADIVGERAPDYYVDPAERDRLLEEVRSAGQVDGFEARMRTRSGEEFWALISARLLEFEGVTALMGGILDITPQKRLEERLRELATRDPLTLAYNRRHFMELCATEIERARRHGHPLSICMIDADNFKAVNDEYGHAVGDQLLQELCRLCRDNLRSSDVLSRIGGEEFVVLFPNTARAGAEGVSQRIVARIAEHELSIHDGRRLRFTISAGVCELEAGDDLHSLLRRADDAMYAAKRAGRNRLVAA
jgi:diguanylate cyclase (GGDEF)-like protein/PAS domain S-box-containing protein